MKNFIIFLTFFLYLDLVLAKDNLEFFLVSAFENNPKLNAERENFKATKENINISRSEFLPSVSLTGSVDSKKSTNRTSQVGANLENTSSKTGTNTISIDQKIFQGFEGYNSLKKSELEVEKSKFQLKKVEQEVLLEAANSYFDLIYKSKKIKFNLANVDLFERQFESDSSRMQKGEITLTDLAQSESSLAGARAELISAKTELLTAKIDFERITRINPPKTLDKKEDFEISLPINLKEAIESSSLKNPQLLISMLDYEISKKDLNIEKAQLSPSASINYSKSENDDFSSTIDNVDQQSVKATITWPIIKGGKNYSSIKKSRFNQKKANLMLQDTKNVVKTSTTNAWSVYQSAKGVLKATESQVQAAEIANEGISLEYDSGNTRTTLEVIQSRSLLLSARIANAKAERNLFTSKINLLAAIGSLSLNSIK